MARGTAKRVEAGAKTDILQFMLYFAHAQLGKIIEEQVTLLGEMHVGCILFFAELVKRVLAAGGHQCISEFRWVVRRAQARAALSGRRSGARRARPQPVSKKPASTASPGFSSQRNGAASAAKRRRLVALNAVSLPGADSASIRPRSCDSIDEVSVPLVVAAPIAVTVRELASPTRGGARANVLSGGDCDVYVAAPGSASNSASSLLGKYRCSRISVVVAWPQLFGEYYHCFMEVGCFDLVWMRGSGGSCS